MAKCLLSTCQYIELLVLQFSIILFLSENFGLLSNSNQFLQSGVQFFVTVLYLTPDKII